MKYSKLHMGWAVIAIAQFACATDASAEPVNLTLSLGGLSDPMLVNNVSTQLVNGMTFEIVLDNQEEDSWGPSNAGVFAVDSVRLTVPDIGIVDELVTSSLAYFEQNDPQRVGLTDLNRIGDVDVSFGLSGTSEIGDPNVIDTVPAMVGVPGVSKWRDFNVTVASGTTISAIAGDTIFFQEASLGPDSDGDNTLDLADNCILFSNPDQIDADSDGIGNFCDADFNNDCAVNAQDLGLLRQAFFTNDAIVDMNSDGIVNSQDLGLLRLAFFQVPGPSSAGPCRVTVASEGFDNNFGGWTGVPDIFYASNGGNPGGYLRFEDGPGSGSFVYAPQEYLGDWSSFNGSGVLEFDHKIFEVLSEFLPVRVTITGSGGMMAQWSGELPSGLTNWNKKIVHIREDHFAQISGTWSEMLHDVTELSIKIAASSNSVDQTGIDNILLVREY